MVTWLTRRPGLVLLIGSGLALAGVGMMAGMLATLATQSSRSTFELPLYAAATDTGSTMSMATGPIDDEVEGVFFLDFLTGELAGVVVASRKPNMINGIFKTNVIKDLGVEADKKPDYLMTTGAATFVGQSGQQQPGRCVVYVLDQNTGNFAGYGFTWNKTAASSLRQQTGAFIKLIAANARAQKVQEQLVQIVCNGRPREIAAGTTIAALLAELQLRGPVAVEVNLELAPRERHAEWLLRDGDELEVVTLVGGG